MSVNSDKLRNKLEAEGFGYASDDSLVQTAYGLRLAPAICLTWTVAGTILASPIILWVLVPFAALGAILPNHPFDVIYNYGLRYLFGVPPLPHYPLIRRIVCMVATAILIGAGWGFYAGLPAVGYSFGGLLMVVSTIYIMTGFCMLSFILRPRSYLRQYTGS